MSYGRATYEAVAFRVIAGGSHPHFTKVNMPSEAP
jgi:hypothetical protein